jgi:hypothetical protein
MNVLPDDLDKNIKIYNHLDSTYRLLILTYGMVMAIMTISYAVKSKSILLLCALVVSITILYGYYNLIKWGGYLVGGDWTKYVYLSFFYLLTTLLFLIFIALLYYFAYNTFHKKKRKQKE